MYYTREATEVSSNWSVYMQDKSNNGNSSQKHAAITETIIVYRTSEQSVTNAPTSYRGFTYSSSSL
jgi:hypothetical protein